jgi:hypothetical protein
MEEESVLYAEYLKYVGTVETISTAKNLYPEFSKFVFDNLDASLGDDLMETMRSIQNLKDPSGPFAAVIALKWLSGAYKGFDTSISGQFLGATLAFMIAVASKIFETIPSRPGASYAIKRFNPGSIVVLAYLEGQEFLDTSALNVLPQNPFL